MEYRENVSGKWVNSSDNIKISKDPRYVFPRYSHQLYGLYATGVSLHFSFVASECSPRVASSQA